MAINHNLLADLRKTAVKMTPWWSQKEYYSSLRNLDDAKEVSISETQKGSFKKEVKDANGNTSERVIEFDYWIYKIKNVYFRVSRKMVSSFVKGEKIREEQDESCGKMYVFQLEKIIAPQDDNQ